MRLPCRDSLFRFLARVQSNAKEKCMKFLFVETATLKSVCLTVLFQSIR